MQAAHLLDRAKSATGSDGLTAKRLGVSAQRISDWRSERRPLPLDVQIKLCQIAELSLAEAWSHLTSQPGLLIQKIGRSAAAIVLLLGGSLAIGFAPSAAHAGGRDGNATMYRTSRRQPEFC